MRSSTDGPLPRAELITSDKGARSAPGFGAACGPIEKKRRRAKRAGVSNGA